MVIAKLNMTIVTLQWALQKLDRTVAAMQWSWQNQT
jgi:hypothetical protein